MASRATAQPQRVVSPGATRCAVVGGGPAGVVLSLLLARSGVPVVLLEAHQDFDRDFRGDTLNPSVLQIMDELGLAERLLALSHSRLQRVTLDTAGGPLLLADLGRLGGQFPYIGLLPQAQMLEFLAREAERYPCFRRVMGASVQALIEADGVVRGVRYRGHDGWHELRALLTVGADGRFSRVRHLAGIEPMPTAAPMDVLWFRLPRRPDDPPRPLGHFGRGALVIQLNRGDAWQIGYVIPKGGYQRLKQAGLDALRQSLAVLLPNLADRVDALTEWRQVSLLSVESSRVPRWYRKGLLLIGDAAHTMSPVGGVGINYAIEDAVAAANCLTGPLRRGRMGPRDLAAVQRDRELPVRVIQAFQKLIQDRVVADVLDSERPFAFPLPLRLALRLPGLRDLPGRLLAHGLRPAHVRTTPAPCGGDGATAS